MRSLALILALLPLPAFAQCPGQSEIFSCQIGKKTLEVCHWKGVLTYDFGTKAKPELYLTVRVEDADFTPWAGIGRTMWDSLAFHNDGITYEVWASLDKQLEENAPEPQVQGGVNVMQGDKTLASLTCNPGSTRSALDTVYTLKTETGQCWNHGTFAWQPAPCT